MMKRVALVAITVVIGLAFVAAAGAAQGTGKMSGVARDAQGQPLPGVRLQLRNVDTGQLVATTRASATGAYEFTGLNPANYIVEIVDDSDQIVGLTPVTALAAGGTITGLTVTASAAGALAGAAAGGAAAFFTSTGGILLLVGIGAGVTAGVVAVTNQASGSR